MTIEERLTELKALKPGAEKTAKKGLKSELAKLEKLNEMKEKLTFLDKMFDKLSTEQCCELLGCDKITFLKYKARLKPAGGTAERPLYNRGDVLKAKQWFESGKKR